jgi:succinylarginine dihydrolase
MRNGGGPACLRLRVVLTPDQAGSVASGVVFDDDLAGTLEGWVARHYRDHLLPEDVADPRLLEESRAALDDLTGILGLGPVYDFQQV